MSEKQKCPDCRGNGIDPDFGTDDNPERDCVTCDGEGVVEMDTCLRCEESVPFDELDANNLCRACRLKQRTATKEI